MNDVFKKTLPCLQGVFFHMRSIGNIRNKSYLSCSLDSYCKLSLMISAAARNTSGQYLRALCHALLQLSYILVIYELGSVSAELAYLFPAALYRACRSFVDFLLFSHCDPPFQSFPLDSGRKLKNETFSERIIVVGSGC